MSQWQETVEIKHPTIGHILGIEVLPNVHQFRGIQYAKLADRFSRAMLLEEYPEVVDATRHGPLPVADPNNCQGEQVLLQHSLPIEEFTFSDIECLTLNVSVPSPEVLQARDGSFPVFVFIHGGGFVTGSASWPQWDLAALVELSVKSGTPIVAVGVNYRLGPFGFLTSKAMRDAGYLPNNGLDDQKIALRWVQKHIRGFSGDPFRVTFAGTSMGAAAGFMHLQLDEPLFSQLYASGGSPILRATPAPVGEFAYSIVVNTLGLSSLSPAEQVKELLRIPAEELSKKLISSKAPINAIIDGNLLPVAASYKVISSPSKTLEVFPGIKWCKKIMMGSCSLDGMIVAILGLNGRTDNYAVAVKHGLSTAMTRANIEHRDDLITRILEEFGIDESEPEVLPILKLATSVGFTLAAKACGVAWASQQDTDVFIHRFNMPNPWPGPWKGYATHALDMAIVLQNYNQYLTSGQRECAERVGKDLVQFVNNVKPFQSFSDGGGLMVYNAAPEEGAQDNSTFVESVKDTGVLESLWQTEPQLLDAVMDGVMSLLMGPPK